MKERPDTKPGLIEVFSTLKKRELWGNLCVHLFILIPVAVLLAFLGRRLDLNWGWEPIPSQPWNFFVAAGCFALGGFITWYSYGYLYLMGGGSPGSHIAYTTRLVDTGIYSWIRHPSIIGKLIGVIGLGILMQTPGFMFVIIPFLLLYSLVTTILIQERFCIRNFGDEYIEYKKNVPMLIPSFKRLSAIFKSGRRR